MDNERDTISDGFSAVPSDIESLSRRVIGLAIDVHRELGPGLPEEAYELAMCLELRAAGIRFSQQHPIQVQYKGTVVARVRIDLLIESKLVMEIKSVEALSPVHRAQVIRYLSILDMPLGLLTNFNVPILKDGLRRVIRHS